MARGWESKSVEAQIESAQSQRRKPAGITLSSEELKRLRERESLSLSRTRVLNDLAAARNPRYQEQMKAALRYPDEKIAALDRASGK